jgi:hypothetical protein
MTFKLSFLLLTYFIIFSISAKGLKCSFYIKKPEEITAEISLIRRRRDNGTWK